MKRTTKIALTGLGILLIGLLFYVLYQDYHADLALLFDNHPAQRQRIIDLIRQHGFKDAFLLTALIAIMCAIPSVPVSVVCVLVGICYGPLLGFCISVAGNLLGNLFIIWLLRSFELSTNHSAKSNRIITDIQKMRHPNLGIALAYMIPVVPSFLVNLTAVHLKLKPETLLLTISCGVIPASFIYSFGGNALLKGHYLGALLLIACIVLLVFLVKFIKRKRKLFDYLHD